MGSLPARLIAAHGIELYGYLQENGYRVEEPCFLYVYEGNAFNDTGYDIRPLDMEYAEKETFSTVPRQALARLSSHW